MPSFVADKRRWYVTHLGIAAERVGLHSLMGNAGVVLVLYSSRKVLVSCVLGSNRPRSTDMQFDKLQNRLGKIVHRRVKCSVSVQGYIDIPSKDKVNERWLSDRLSRELYTTM